jgi:hypothetical protein
MRGLGQRWRRLLQLCEEVVALKAMIAARFNASS